MGVSRYRKATKKAPTPKKAEALLYMVPRDGFEPSTRGFSVLMTYYFQPSDNQ